MAENDEFLLEDEDDEKTIEFIKNYLPQDLKGKFSDDELYYFLDVSLIIIQQVVVWTLNLIKMDTSISTRMRL